MYFKLAGNTIQNQSAQAITGAANTAWWVNFQPTQNEFWFEDLKPGQDLTLPVTVQGSLTQFSADGITPQMALTMYVPVTGSILAGFGGMGGQPVNIQALNTFLATLIPFEVTGLL